jgi:epsin
LEFLIKNGSERVIDDARSHLSLLKMLRQFHFIDLNGKDQGINVRNRSKELVELLSDVDKIRTERKKARANRTKYSGYEGGGGLGSGSMGSGSMGGGSRMGGFGSESSGYGQYNGGVYGDGGGFGGQESSSNDYQDTQSRRDRFEEYDEYDEGAASTPARKKANSITSPSTSVRRETQKAKAPAKPKEPEEDLFDFGDEPIVSSSNSKAPALAPAPSSGLGVLDAADDDEFDDFQSAAPPTAAAATTSVFTIAPPASTSTTTSTTQFAAPQPRSGSQGQTINDLFASVSPPPPRTGSTASSAAFTPLSSAPAATPQMQPFKAPQPANYQASGPNYFQSVPLASPAQSSAKSTPTTMGSLGKPLSTPGAKSGGGGDAFASLLGGAASKKPTGATKGASMADLARQKTSAGIWGTTGGAGSAASTPGAGSAAPPAQQQKAGGGLDDLLG